MTVQIYNEDNVALVTFNHSEIERLVNVIEGVLPHLEVLEHDGDIEADLVDELSEEHRKLCRILDSLND